MSESTVEQIEKMTQADVASAEIAEQAALNASQTAYLLRRVIVLRAQLNRATEDLQFARLEIQRLHAPKEGADQGSTVE